MPEISSKTPSIDTLLAVMSNQLDTLIKKFEKLEEKIEGKVDYISFDKLEKAFEEHKKETDSKIDAHTVKLTVGSTIVLCASWFVTHFIK